MGQQIIIADGAYGTLLQSHFSGHIVPEELNLSHPQVVKEVHRAYAKNGADFLTSNTFGANGIKLKEAEIQERFQEINLQAVTIARQVADEFGIWVAGNISACGQLLQPLGILTFAEARQNFAEQAKLLEEAGVDFILIETITEIQEFRAAVIGALTAVKIPVIASMSFTDGERALSGTDGQTFAVSGDFSALQALGANCGTTLEAMRGVMTQISTYSGKPLLCQANAGVPQVENGRTTFPVTAPEYADFMEEMYQMGISIIGSCCGSTPEFTAQLSQRFKGEKVIERQEKRDLRISSRTLTRSVRKDKIFLVGERINPTGRKKLRKELEQGKLTTVRLDAREQEVKNSDALDININLHKLDRQTARKIILSVQNITSVPLVIDSTDADIIEDFCQLYAGKGIINSISGERKSYQTLLPLAREYNMAFISTLLDDQGIPDSIEGRLAIARKMANRTIKLGIKPENIIFDPLVLSAGAEVEKVGITLGTLAALKEEFPDNKTIIGLSNISFGLPRRELVNSSFLAMAVAKGLDMVIANPLHESIQEQLMVLNFLRSGHSDHLTSYTKFFATYSKKNDNGIKKGSDNLSENILAGDVDSAVDNIQIILRQTEPLEIINQYIIPAMQEVGRRYEAREFYLPQLIASAEVVKSVLPDIKEKMPLQAEENKKTIVIATVAGDIHDIGKNVVSSILESFNYTVIDLGKDVSPRIIVEKAIEHQAQIIGLSTLMTTTLPAMMETIQRIRQAKQLQKTIIFAGGAVVNKRIAADAGVLYAADGMEMVKQIKQLPPV